MQKKHHPFRTWHWTLLLLCLGVLAVPGWAQEAPPRESSVCADNNLLRAVQIIHESCGSVSCNFEKLLELEHAIDKSAFLGALNHPEMQSFHIFFPINKYKVSDAFDWETVKRNQLDSLRYASVGDNTAIFVIGSASQIGNEDYNRNLSADRMRDVRTYLEDTTDCDCFHGGYLGEDILQMNVSDASFLGVNPGDFRNDQNVLNQAVHVFFYPCRHRLPEELP